MNFIEYFYDLFSEARRNLFPKQTVLSVLEKYKGTDDIFVSFREPILWTSATKKVKKTIPVGIGLNPRNNYSTPTGIYGYPLKPLWKSFINNSLPFANGRPTLVVYTPDLDNFKEGEKIIRSSDFSKQDLEEAVERIKNLLNYTDDDVQAIDDRIDPVFKKTPFKTFWSYTREISIEKTKHIQRNSENKNVHYWTNLLIKLGYPIISDDSASGTIHPNEPTQCFVCAKKYVKVLEIIENKNWSSLEGSSMNVFIQKILDSLYVQPLKKWYGVLEKSNNLFIERLVKNIFLSDNLIEKIQDSQDFKILNLPENIPDDNRTVIFYPKKYNIINKQLVDFLKQHKEEYNISNFLFYYLGSKTNLDDEQQQLLKDCAVNVVNNPDKSDDYSNLIFKIPATYNKIKNLDGNDVNIILNSLVNNYKKVDGHSRQTIAETCVYLLTRESIDKNSDVWQTVLYLKNHDNSYFSDFMNRLVPGLFNIDFFVLKNKLPEWLSNYFMELFNENIVIIPYNDNFQFIQHNKEFISQLNLNKTCNYIAENCFIKHDPEILDLCIKRLSSFDKSEIRETMNSILKDVSMVVSDFKVIEVFSHIKGSLRQFLLKEHDSLVDVLIRCGLKKKDISVEELMEIVGQENFSNWAKTKADHITEYTDNAKIINYFAENYISDNWGVANFLQQSIYNRETDVVDVFSLLKYFSSFDSSFRKLLIKKTNYNDLPRIVVSILGISYSDLLIKTHQILNSGSGSGSVANLEKEIREFIFTDNNFVEKLMITRPNFIVPALKGLIPVFSTGDIYLSSTLANLFQDYKIYSERDVNIKRPDGSLPTFTWMFLKKKDVQNILQKSNNSIPDNYFTTKIFNEELAKESVLSLKQFINKVKTQEQDFLVPLINNNDALLSLLQLKQFSPSSLYIYSGDGIAKSVEELKIFDIDEIVFPLLVTEKTYTGLFGQLPEEYIKIANHEQPSISQNTIDSVIDKIKKTSYSSRIKPFNDELYIIIPSDYVTDLGFFKNDVKILKYGSLSEYTNYDYVEYVYVKLQEFKKIIGSSLVEDLYTGSINPESIKKIIDYSEKGIPEFIKEKKPKNPGNSNWTGKDVVVLGQGKDSTSTWEDELKIQDGTLLYVFTGSDWRHTSNFKLNPEFYYALEKNAWEKLTGKKVADSYFETDFDNQLVEKLIKNHSSSILLYDAYKIKPTNTLKTSNDIKLVLIGRGNSANPWSTELDVDISNMYALSENTREWYYGVDGKIEKLLYAIPLKYWSAITKQHVHPEYYSDSFVQDVYQTLKQEYISAMVKNSKNIPANIREKCQKQENPHVSLVERQLVFLGYGINHTWHRATDINNIFHWTKDEWGTTRLRGDSTTFLYACDKDEWEKFCGKKVDEQNILYSYVASSVLSF